MLGGRGAVARSVTGVNLRTQPTSGNARYRPGQACSSTCTIQAMLPFSSSQKCLFGQTNWSCQRSSGRCVVKGSSTSARVRSATAQSGSCSHPVFHLSARSGSLPARIRNLLPAPAQHAGLRRSMRASKRRPRVQTAALEGEGLVPLGLDFLTFLAATVLVIPLFKSVKASPVLGFLFSGIVLGQLG